METKGKTLEEIDALFEGEKHSTVPDVEEVRKGHAHIDVGALEEKPGVEVSTSPKPKSIGKGKDD